MVPGIDGFGVLQYIKEQKINIATIMLTALEDEKTQVKAFNLYADDYVIKPVSPIILLKRMETILRRVAPKERKEQQSSFFLLFCFSLFHSSYFFGVVFGVQTFC